MRIVLDAGYMHRPQLQDYLQKMLPLPEYYGRNLDALYDSLTELFDTQITIEHIDRADAYFSVVRRVFEAAAEENDGLIVEFE